MSETNKHPIPDFRIIEAAGQFLPAGISCHIEPLGNGNINDTYLVKGGRELIVLQRLNGRVFPHPKQVAENFVKVTEHIKARLAEDPDQWEIISSVPTLAQAPFFKDSQGDIWRAQRYLEDTVTHSVIVTSQQAQQVGWILGRFHSLLADLSPSVLDETLPGFHNLPLYMQRFEKTAACHQRPSSSELSFCLDFIGKKYVDIDVLERATKTQKLTLQVIHGDPKVDNILFRKGTDIAVGLIDLDTVGVGLLHYDIGDCLRSCCNSSGEKERKVERVYFDLDMCRNILNGYYSAAGELICENDKKYVYEAISAITYELGVRFLTDYLAGNIYFKVTHEKENLHRALLQFRLVENIMEQEQDIRRVAEE